MKTLYTIDEHELNSLRKFLRQVHIEFKRDTFAGRSTIVEKEEIRHIQEILGVKAV